MSILYVYFSTSINIVLFMQTFRYGREYADPYLGHGIGPVPGYGVSNLFFIVLAKFSISSLALK